MTAPTNTPVVRTDLVDVYVFRQQPRTPLETTTQVLQLRRVEEDPTEPHSLHGTWQPVMGHLEDHESPEQAAARELLEETGFDVTGPHCRRFKALEQVHPYYLPHRNAIMLSPRFIVEAAADWEPTLNHEHDAHRWIPLDNADADFMWPGQRACLAELRDTLARE